MRGNGAKMLSSLTATMRLKKTHRLGHRGASWQCRVGLLELMLCWGCFRFCLLVPAGRTAVMFLLKASCHQGSGPERCVSDTQLHI